jgi:hypothetical protein
MGDAVLPAEAPAVLKLARSLMRSIEDLLLAGLTTAGASTQEQLALALREAARMRLLRLGSTLRVVAEEMSRFDKDPDRFSPQRLSFFLNRTWILCNGIARAIEQKDPQQLSRLLATPSAAPVAELRLALVGVVKRVAARVFSSFEFRMISLVDSPPVSRGMQVVWSCVFPAKEGVDLQPEAYLHLPQKQGFKPMALLAKKPIVVTDASAAIDAAGVGRLVLGDASKVAVVDEPVPWMELVSWSPVAAAERVARAVVTPIDLDIEMQELVALAEWSAQIPPNDSPANSASDCTVLSGSFSFTLSLDDATTRKALAAANAATSRRPTLVGLLHYESCRFLLQPIGLLSDGGPDYITIAQSNISIAQLVKSLALK